MTELERTQLETATAQFAAQISIPYYDSRTELDIVPLIGRLTLEGMAAYKIIPLAATKTEMVLGISENTDRSQLDALKARLSAYTLSFRYVSSYGWDQIFRRYSLSDYLKMIATGDYSWLEQKLINAGPKVMFEPLSQLAYLIGASDIHLEPGDTSARVRFRIDGTLQPILTIPRERYDLLTSDLQLRAGAKWNADTPQSGRVSLELTSKSGATEQVNMRLETIPSLHGQDVVIRLFNLAAGFMQIKNIHLPAAQEAALLKAISHPKGLILAVGPTGSGKTSTLYSIMNHLNSPNSKLVSLEDPVEYELAGVIQIPVRSDEKESFTEKLRAVLREDPNVVMIGEIRDADTAKTALQAALTGHLVLSSFHAASAATAVTRLMDMNGQNSLLASALRMIMAQRLVRKLCESCKTAYEPSKAEILQIKTSLHGLAAAVQPKLEGLKLFKAVGCSKCNNFGYSGRLVVTEQLETSPEMESLIGSGTVATTASAIELLATQQGMITLAQNGVLSAIAGITTLEEVYRAIGD
jgi:type II secretory ATPase GspE/PulE/Tfp pilus assembly ATPase PilB-like protein